MGCHAQPGIGQLNKFIMTFKQKIFLHYRQLIDDKVRLLAEILSELKESGANETKSTAGDKHETALAMIQIEQENTLRQWNVALTQKAAFENIDESVKTIAVTNGSLIKTNKGYFLLGIALGKIILDGNTVIAISSQSPLGIKLMGLKTEDSAEINGIRYTIERIE